VMSGICNKCHKAICKCDSEKEEISEGPARMPSTLCTCIGVPGGYAGRRFDCPEHGIVRGFGGG
jgi:hypothetical protein